MLVFMTWAFELAAATAIGGMVTVVALVAGLAIWAHTPRTSADLSAPPAYAADDATGHKPG